MQNLLNGECVSKEVSDALYAELKSWSVQGGCDAFRYEQFARRIVAAEYGRPDAVVWALDWYWELQERAIQKKAKDAVAAEEFAAERKQGIRKLAEGRADNPLYQAYLDTLETIQAEDEMGICRLNAGYFAFHSQRTAEYQQTCKQGSFEKFVREYAEQHLSERAKRRRHSHH